MKNQEIKDHYISFNVLKTTHVEDQLKTEVIFYPSLTLSQNINTDNVQSNTSGDLDTTRWEIKARTLIVD